MAHKEQWEFCDKVKKMFPKSFTYKTVLDIGSFDVNGNEEFLFDNCVFVGLDIGPGPGVDIVCPAQDYNAPDEWFDTIVSCECWEHNPEYAASIINAIRMLKPGGLFFFTCATTGRAVHGVKYLEEESKLKWENWKTMPNVSRENWNNDYYKNLTEEDIYAVFDPNEYFARWRIEINESHHDLYFWGIKSVNWPKEI